MIRAVIVGDRIDRKYIYSKVDRMGMHSWQQYLRLQEALGLTYGHNNRQPESRASPLNCTFVSRSKTMWRSGLVMAGRCGSATSVRVSRCVLSLVVVCTLVLYLMSCYTSCSSSRRNIRRNAPVARSSSDGNHVAMPFSSDPISDMDGRKIFILEDMSMEQLNDFHMRLCENDVEYHDLKSMCKLNGLGGKDMKYNLRAKLIRKVREMLGKPVWDRRSYGRRVKLPSAMSDIDLAKFYKQREVVMPDDKEDAIGLAFAMLVVDGAISQDVVPTTSAYDKLNTKRLIQICQKRNLPTKGNKAELLARLVDYDAQREKKVLADKAADAARRELQQATIDVPPRPPNRAMASDLREAQNTMASVSEMDLPYLRAALLARNLPIYGTSEVLIERLTNVLRKDVIEAHAGLGRMVKYAEAAVSKLNDEEVYEALAARGLASFSVGEDSSSRLANALVEEWIHAAMMPNTVDWDSEEDQQHQLSDIDESNADDDPIDPTINVTLLCDGVTKAERANSIRAAREILPTLQSDQIWGTLMPYTSSSLQANFDEVFDSSPDCSGPPTEVVEIMYLTPSVNGVVATMSTPLPPLGSIFRVYATPSDGDDAPSVMASGLSQDIVLKGLRPGTAYEFTVTIVNKLGEGPRSEPYHAATLLRQGVSVSVVYPITAEDDEKKFTELSWEELYGWDEDALDSLLLAQEKERQTVSEDDFRKKNSIVLPMGRTSRNIKGMDSISALSVFDTSRRHDSLLRNVILENIRSAGFNPLPLFTLNESNAASSEEKLQKWSEDNGIDPIVARFRMKISDNQGPLFAVVCRGLEVTTTIIDDLKNETENFKGVVVEVEHLFKDAVSLEVSVVGTENGPVALIPTEIDYFDINDFIEISDIEVTRLAYQNEGYDIDMLERVVKLKREDVLIPASYDSKDKDLSQSRKIRHQTPPSSISVGLMNHARLAAVKLFEEMGLRDYAKISFIVAPESDVEETTKDQLALVAFDSGAKKVWEADENYCSVKVESFASLAEKEAADKEKRKAVQGSLISQHAEKAVSIGSEVPTTRYGEIFGIPIDDKTRADIKERQGSVSLDQIRREPPSSTFEGLNDASSLDIASINSIVENGRSRMIYVSNIDIVPDFDRKVGVLAQQLVASGLSLNWLPKHLISLAAIRQGQPTLVDASVSIEEIRDGDEDWVGVHEREVGEEPEEVTMEDIAKAIDGWESDRNTQDISHGTDEEKELIYDEISNQEEIDVALEQSVATLNQSDDLESSMDEETSADVSKVLAQQFPGLHPCRQRVWVLCGGEGYQRDESLQVAAAAMKALQGAPDLLLETFMLDPPNAGHSNDIRLKSLVSLRENLLKSGASDSFLFSEIPYLHPAQIKAPQASLPQDLNRRGVWRLAGSNIVRETVEDMRNSIDRITRAHKLTVVSRSPGDDLHKIEQITSATKASLDEANVSIDYIRAPWGGSLQKDGPENIPKYLSLHDWAVAASEKCAVVLMLLPGHPSAYGPIQELMDEIGVPYTGPSKIAADLCHERPELLRSLTDAVNYDGSIISAPPAHSISALELRATCQSEESANEFFSRLFGSWENKMMTIRPSVDSGVGILRMKSGRDLMAYNRAVHTWAESISATEENGSVEDIKMPLPPPTQFVIEPFLAAEPIKIVEQHQDQVHEVIEDPIYGHVVWNTRDNWLEVKGSLLGGSGTMRCLGLSTTMAHVSPDGSISSFFEVTPPPTSILSEETAGDTMLRLQLVCDRLGLSGAAQIHLLVNAVTGEIVVNEVDVHPNLSPSSLLVRQAALISPPMSHVEILRELLKEAMSRGEQSADADATESTMYPVDEFSASMGGILDAPDAPNPTQNYFGDPYLKVEDGYQYGFEGIIDMEEEESDDDDFDSEVSSDEY